MGEDLLEPGVAAEALAVPRVGEGLPGGGRHVEGVQDHLVVPGAEPLPALTHVERFGEVGEGYGGLDDDEVADFGGHLADADLQPFKLGVDEG